MGYEIRIDLINIRIKKEHVELIKRAIKGDLEDISDIYYMVENLKVLRNRCLFWRWDPIGKWYKDEEFAAWLSQYVERGFVAFWGQEGNGDNWAYEFDGEGNMMMCSGRRAAAIKGLINKA